MSENSFNVLKDDKKVDKHKKYSKSNLSSRELNLLNDMLFPDDIKISFEDICGLDNAKNFLKKNVCNILDLRSHDIPAFPKSAFPPSGILIHGPPGCGKTMICTALAKMCFIPIIIVKTSTIVDRFYGESEKNIRSLFSLAKKTSPCILFLDEIDCITSNRNNVSHEPNVNILGEMLGGIDSIRSNDIDNIVIVIGATNRPCSLDPALSSRLPLKMKINHPNDEARKQMILNKTENIYISEDLIENLVKFTAGMDGTEINEKCRQWCVNALHRYIDQCGSQIELLYEDIDSDIFALKEANIELELYSS